MLHFITPIRHPSQIRDEAAHRLVFAETLRSLSVQTGQEWRGWIVANRGAPMPELPPRFEWIQVDFPPNEALTEANNLEAFYEAIRADKGLRILQAAMRAEADDYLMVVDEDDLVHRDVTRYIEAQPPGPGWVVKDGFRWHTPENRIEPLGDFHRVCGSSLIVRADKYLFFAEKGGTVSQQAINELGSHRLIFDRLESVDTPLEPLPFRASIYRWNYVNTTQQDIREKGLRTERGLRGMARRTARALRGWLRSGLKTGKTTTAATLPRLTDPVLRRNFLGE